MTEPSGQSDATAWRDAFIALGSNLGDREGFLRQAVAALSGHEHVRVVGVSAVYETRAHTLRADEVQPSYLNAVVHVVTDLSPDRLLVLCQSIERQAGRDRVHETRWAPRTLDLDILAIGDLVRSSPDPILPHPRLGERRFVLQPLADLAPNYFVPLPYAARVIDLLARCPDQDQPIRTTIDPT